MFIECNDTKHALIGISLDSRQNNPAIGDRQNITQHISYQFAESPFSPNIPRISGGRNDAMLIVSN
jgi:hypothetical protein